MLKISLALILIISPLWAADSSFSGEDERMAVLSAVQSIIKGADKSDDGKGRKEPWPSIQFETDVFYRKNSLESNEYTVYGRSEFLTPSEYKIHFKAKISDDSEKGKICKLENNPIVIDAQGNTVVTYDHKTGSYKLADSLDYFKNKKLEKLLNPAKDFYEQKNYSPETRVETSKKDWAIPSLNGLAQTASGDLLFGYGEYKVGSMVLSRIPKTYRGLKLVRMGGILYLTGETAAHGEQMWEVVTHGKDEVSMFPITDYLTIKNIKNGITYGGKKVGYQLEETGVLKSPDKYLEELERHEQKRSRVENDNHK